MTLEQQRRILSDRLTRERRQQVTENLMRERRERPRRLAERNAKLNLWERRFHQARGTLQ